MSQETQEFDLHILKQQSSDSSGLNKIEEIQEKLKYRFKRIDKRLRKEDLRKSSHVIYVGPNLMRQEKI